MRSRLCVIQELFLSFGCVLGFKKSLTRDRKPFFAKYVASRCSKSITGHVNFWHPTFTVVATTQSGRDDVAVLATSELLSAVAVLCTNHTQGFFVGKVKKVCHVTQL